MKTTTHSHLHNFPAHVETLIAYKEAQGLSVYQTIEEVRRLEREIRDKIVVPERKPRPRLESPLKASASDARLYADELEKWETYEKGRKAKELKRTNAVPNHGKLLEDFIKHFADFDNVPKEYQEKVYSYAWSKGHSSGYSEVFNELLSLVEIFE
jgi:hypothetical protein